MSQPPEPSPPPAAPNPPPPAAAAPAAELPPQDSPPLVSPRYPDLQDCAVLISGGAAGIGAALCRSFVEQGARVISLDRDAAGHRRLEQQCAAGPGSLQGLEVDLCDGPALVRCLAEVRQRLPDLRVVIANAGYDPRFDGLAMEEADWNGLFQLNVTHAFLLCRELLPQLVANGSGSVILTASHTAWIAKPDLIAYNSTKAALVGLCRSLAEAYGSRGIRVNAVAPGWTMTERQLRQWVTAEALEETVQRLQALPLTLTPELIAQPFLFLASDASRCLTRQVLIADAGQTKI
jgi:NAD(P)-dependent dehydrogenase (short-subunit alcohol dehydrogenase family)